jgi:sigma-E factor negative regulatory protein RseB
MVRASRTTAVATAALAASFAALADDARGLLERMERALATGNYQGTFVHQHDGQSETLRILHRVSGNEIVERIVSLDGSGREIIRRDGELTAYFPDQRVALVQGGPRESLLLGDLSHLDSAAAQMYRIIEEAPTRVSGRSARVVAVEPQDELRYGYRVWIDESSAMPLKTQLRTAAGRVVEQLVFTELTLPTHIADAALQPGVVTRDYRWIRHQTTTAADGEVADTTWDASELPPGFRLTANSTQVLAGAKTPVTHLVFSDGLASVSVFVEPQAATPGRSPAPATMTSLGSSSALSTEVDGHRITAIGEVPPGTVRAIAGSLRSGFAPEARAGGRRPH